MTGRVLAALAILCAPAWAGYQYKGAVTFPAASGSTQTNITLAFTFSDALLKTAANGGAVQNTVTRVGVTVPADLVFTDDATCATVTGSYTWGIETYSATAGTGVGWLMVPSHSSAAATVPTVCVGNAAVSTYQGGSQGAEWDSNTRRIFLVPDGTTLSGLDFSSVAGNLTLVGPPTAVTGKVGGGAGFNGSTQYGYTSAVGTANTSGFTISAWVKASSTAGEQIFLQNGTDDVAGNPNGYGLEIESGNWKVLYSGVARIDSGTAASTGAWHHLALSNIAGVAQIYIDGVAAGSTFSTTPITPVSTVSIGAQVVNSSTHTFQRQFSGSSDVSRVASAGRSANWIATEYANQNNPPAIGALTALATSAPRLMLLGVGD